MTCGVQTTWCVSVLIVLETIIIKFVYVQDDNDSRLWITYHVINTHKKYIPSIVKNVKKIKQWYKSVGQ